MARYMIFDEETSTKESFKRKANPFDNDNWIVARGWKYKGDVRCSWVYYNSKDEMRTMEIPDDVTVLVGHNLKFDLMYELCKGNDALVAFFKRGGKIWCTQYAQYLIEGQTQESQMCSLDSIVEMYGGRLKIDEVKTMWEMGVDTPDIPKDLLIDYLVGTEEEDRNSGDIGNTECVFLGQVKRAVEQGQVKMIQDRMDGLIATTFMEFFGLKIDVQVARKNLLELSTELKSVAERLNEQVKELPWAFNWGSGIQMSAMLFGGTVKYQVREPYKDENGEWVRKKAFEQHWLLNDGSTTPHAPGDDPENSPLQYQTFKSGKSKGEYKTKKVEVTGERKIKWQDRFHEFAGITEPDESWQGKQTDAADKPIYSTGKDTIKALEQRVENGLDLPFLRDFVRKAALDKEIGTYYVSVDPKTGNKSGMLTCVQPSDHMLHHKLNHTNTVTTRLSSNDPNLQNLPRGDKSKVKEMFTSRFGADGVMVEADYSQLEVVVQGVLSGDVQLCQDLRDKIDFHCKRVSAQFSISYELAVAMCKGEDHPEHKIWQPRRTKAKNFSFQRAYGAGAKAIAAATGMTVEEVEALIAAEEALYPGVIKFNADVESAVMASAIPFQAPAEDGATDATGKPIWKTYRKGEWYSPTRTRYTWRTHDAPAFLRKRGILDSFSPPELKNYPVQGTGGEFVQGVLGLLIRRFIETDFYGGKAYLVNTVHDCVWIDCHRDVLDKVCTDVKRIMESIPEFYGSRYCMVITVPFPVEVEVGPNMYTMKHWVPGQPAWHHANDNGEEQHAAA